MPKFRRVCAWRDSGVSLKDLAEEDRVLVADGIADFLHGTVVAFKQTLGAATRSFCTQINGLSPLACLKRRRKLRRLMLTRSAGVSRENV